MGAQAFRSPLAKFALALWIGCLHWPFIHCDAYTGQHMTG